MKLRFGLRELLSYVTVAAFVSALFVYLPLWDAIFLALLVAVSVPLSYVKNERLEALFWCLAAALICYHLGVLLSFNRRPRMAYLMSSVCWTTAICYGLRKQIPLRNRILVICLVVLFAAYVLIPDDYGRDTSILAHEHAHWLGISGIVTIAGVVAICTYQRQHET